MNSVLEYVRQLNQQSVTLRNEWLDRLRHVECEPGDFSRTPEIQLSKPPGLRGSDSESHSAPITVLPINYSDAGLADNIGSDTSQLVPPVPILDKQSNTNQVNEVSGTQPPTIERITDQLVARFPVVSSATIMFASLTPGIDVDNVAAKVATCLANRDLGGILLIDANTNSGELSSMMGSLRSPGLTELVNRTETLSAVVCSTDNGNLEFLPCGNGDVTHRRFDAMRATALGKEFNQAFQYTIISGGVVDNSLVQCWSGFVDALYLLIDLSCADKQKTMEALTALRHQAVRIAGIIAVVE